MKNVKKILIVDDDFDQLEQLNLHVHNMGFETILKESQKEAEEYIKTEQPDLAILDLMMEQEDSGAVLAYRIKKQYPSTPIIIATAVTSETGIKFKPEDDIDKKWIKADAFLEKNIRPEQLKKEINKLLDN